MYMRAAYTVTHYIHTAGDKGPRGHPWSDEAMAEWLESVLVELQAGGSPQAGPSSAEGMQLQGEKVMAAA